MEPLPQTVFTVHQRMRVRVLFFPLIGLAAGSAIVFALSPIPAIGGRGTALVSPEDAGFAPRWVPLERQSEREGIPASVGFPPFRSAKGAAYFIQETVDNYGDEQVLPDESELPTEAVSVSSGRMVEIVFIRPPPARVPDPGIRAIDVDLPLYDAWLKFLSDSPRPRRAQAYLTELKAIFADAGLPEEFVWLAEAESSFNPRAVSACGARGLFQLMPYIALEQGLRLHPYDERNDPHKNARAAAAHLRQLYVKFKSWPLALAAYNAGEGCVRRRLKAADAQTLGEIADALPLETRVYVAKVLAVLVVREGLDAGQLDALLGR